MTDATWEPIPWGTVREGMIESGQITEEGVQQARVEREAYVAGYRLGELRNQTGMTQVQLANSLGISQARVSAMECGDVDALTIASIRSYVDALGGTVQLVASVDDTDIPLELPDQRNR